MARIGTIIKDKQETVYYKLCVKRKHKKKRHKQKKLTFNDYDKMMKHNKGIDENKRKTD